MSDLPKMLRRNSWLEEATSIVHSGGVVALPFERLFGLAANALNEEALNKIQAIKNRTTPKASKQPISVIVPDFPSLKLVAETMTETAMDLADRFWPGPLTILVKARPSLPPALVGPGGLVGVRLAGSCPADELAKNSDLVLSATSANLTGGPDAISHNDIINLSGVDAVVEGEVVGPPGSTIVDCSGTSPILLREGCVNLRMGDR